MQLINFYNIIHSEDPNSILTILRENILPITLYNSSLLLGDFNTHYLSRIPLNLKAVM